MSLPDADFKATASSDKMSLYEKARKDSADSQMAELLPQQDLPGYALPIGSTPAAENEAAIALKLSQIRTEINKAPSAGVHTSQSALADPGAGAEVAKLEKLMQQMQQPAGEDPEMQQLNLLMDKILSIQNPDRPMPGASTPGIKKDSVFKAIPAVVARDQKVRQGSVVEMRLLDTIRINGLLIPKGHAVYAVAKFSNQRINLEIKTLRMNVSVIPADLTVFDQQDAMAGIYAPEALISEAMSDGGTDALTTVGIGGLDQSVGVKLAGAGIDAARGLISKKLQRVHQKLRAGYSVLIRDNTLKRP
ncbi:MAG: conjugative transposon protein TraM [Pedobacter sp.]|nr:MAG: conjugative transposon protein TraM [Pedobacter sp.]